MKKTFIIACVTTSLFSTAALADKAGDAAACLEKICLPHNGAQVCLQEGKHFRFSGGESSPTENRGRSLQVHPDLRNGSWTFWASEKDDIEACFKGAWWR